MSDMSDVSEGGMMNPTQSQFNVVAMVMMFDVAFWCRNRVGAKLGTSPKHIIYKLLEPQPCVPFSYRLIPISNQFSILVQPLSNHLFFYHMIGAYWTPVTSTFAWMSPRQRTSTPMMLSHYLRSTDSWPSRAWGPVVGRRLVIVTAEETSSWPTMMTFRVQPPSLWQPSWGASSILMELLSMWHTFEDTHAYESRWLLFSNNNFFGLSYPHLFS